MSTILNIQVTCDKCNQVRFGKNALLECSCTLKYIFSSDQRKEILDNLKMFEEISKMPYYYSFPSTIDSVYILFCLIKRMSNISKQLILHDERTHFFSSISETITKIRKETIDSYSVFKNGPEMWLEVMYPPFTTIATLRYTGCMYVNMNGSSCIYKAENFFCSDHIGWFYVAHNELIQHGVNDHVTRLCLQYIIPDYDQVAACIPSRPNTFRTNKRARIEIECE